MGSDLQPGALLPAAAIGSALLLLLAGLHASRTAGSRAIQAQLRAETTPAGAPRSEARHGERPAGLGNLLGPDAPPTAVLCLAVIGTLLGLITGELLDLRLSGRLAASLFGTGAVFAAKAAAASARDRNLGPLVHAFIQDVHLSAMSGETAVRAIFDASARAAQPLRSYLHQARLAVQSGEGAFAAYARIGALADHPEYQGFIYSLWLHEQTASSFGQLLGRVVEQSDEATLAKRELAAKLGEARWTARVLAGVPLVLLVYLQIAQPDFVAPLGQEAVGRQALLLGGVLWTAGLVVSNWLQRPPLGLGREG